MAKRKGQVVPMGESRSKEFAGDMLKMLIAGFAGGFALLAGAKAVGDALFPEEGEEKKDEE